MKKSILISMLCLLVTISITSCFTDYRVRDLKTGQIILTNQAKITGYEVGDTVALEYSAQEWDIDVSAISLIDTAYIYKYNGLGDTTYVMINRKIGVIEKIY